MLDFLPLPPCGHLKPPLSRQRLLHLRACLLAAARPRSALPSRRQSRAAASAAAHVAARQASRASLLRQAWLWSLGTWCRAWKASSVCFTVGHKVAAKTRCSSCWSCLSARWKRMWTSLSRLSCALNMSTGCSALQAPARPLRGDSAVSRLSPSASCGPRSRTSTVLAHPSCRSGLMVLCSSGTHLSRNFSRR